MPQSRSVETGLGPDCNRLRGPSTIRSEFVRRGSVLQADLGRAAVFRVPGLSKCDKFLSVTLSDAFTTAPASGSCSLNDKANS
ncbi:hypothetical protein NDU88_010704 [Pleurodeles waltl]|uniref:Uncharacterized protein n=1 Tax=Pleurodeles waltl TaxID=8319 RepID=A0AAV7QWM7_PLEWA|nr:hypothetical protein NDU88_010704 [Pleurodeles waltl]